ncbi:hypothetical protein KUTeg_017144 [Tegillarca granosa]|uniref:Tyrosine-protein phosphatase domain-containing protein n=1 Tax=Tegillarca granosa TaxID=220873 RepID=A0ABQ9ENS5_TEGGR|nr:hypothetical protein KUTeg_017144 [Tegillarca granosa]
MYVYDYIPECPAGKYGADCKMTCGNCLYSDNQQHNTCNKTTGLCPGNSCQDGYQGEMCHDLCDDGKFGRGCALTCGLCKEGSCNPVNGTCTDGCEAGYDGVLCANYCAEGTYGEGCSNKCGHCKGGEPCNRFNGECVEGCADGYTGDVCAKAMVSNTAEASIIGGVVAAVVIFVAVIIIVIIIYRRRRFQEVLKVQVDEEDIQKSPFKEVDTSHIAKETDQLIEAESPIGQSNNYDLKEPIYVNVNSTRQSCPVKVEHLYDYINQNKMHECEGFKKEFGDLPHGLTALCENAKTQANRPKNRYGNIIAYDHSRVVLDQLPNDPSSSYINANYMNGYTQPNAYIASQG